MKQLFDELTLGQEAYLVAKEIADRRLKRKIDAYYTDQGCEFFGKYYPARDLYPKHLQFFEAGAKYASRLISAANRVGKTEGIGGYEVACHVTGEYPEWWVGKRFERPGSWVVAGDTSKSVRDSVQRKLLGPMEALGTGLIPHANISRVTRKSGVTDAVDQAWIKHERGITKISFKSYEEGRTAFQAVDLQGVWLDEEPPADVAEEATMRTMDTEGIVLYTFTPLMGITAVVKGFMPGGKLPFDFPGDRWAIQATWEDAPHLTERMKARQLEEIAPHLRDARTKGIPALGAGAIYPVNETDIIVDPIEIPEWWPRAYGFDVGWNKTAALWGAWDRDNDIIYLTGEYYRGEAEPPVHTAAIQARGNWIPGAIDPAAKGRSQVDGRRLIEEYRQSGLILHYADNTVEAGIYHVWKRLSTGRMKVFKGLENWLSEYRTYHRNEKGEIVKTDDHLMDCTRYLNMTGMRVAITEPFDDGIVAERHLVQGRSKTTGY